MAEVYSTSDLGLLDFHMYFSYKTIYDLSSSILSFWDSWLLIWYQASDQIVMS